METEQLAATAAGSIVDDHSPIDPDTVDAVLIDAIVFQVALYGWRPTIAVIRALCDSLEANHGR